MRNLFVLLFLVIAVPVMTLRAQQPEIGVVTVKEAIGPTTASYIARGISLAEENGYEALIIELDTPGGLLNSTSDIVQDILASRVPVIVYVTPSGGGAISAGVFITLASHIAAMSPATNIGAATPVQMGGEGMDEDQREKLMNYAVSYIESIAARRDRNVEWAKSAVREAASVSETEALELEIIEIIAENRDSLIARLHGWEVEEFVLNTENAITHEIGMTQAERVLRFLFNPQVMMILMIIAIYGIIGEISNPGAIIPGVAGVIALILLLYTVAAMPINVAGFVLIALAIILFVSEAFTPTFGLLTVAGAVAFFIGSLMLFQDLAPVYQLSWVYLVPATLLTALFFALVVASGLRAQFMEIKAGRETMLGKQVEAFRQIDPHGGKVFIQGEIWNAVSDEVIPKGGLCEIVEIKGLTMKVRPVKQEKNQEENK